MSFVERFDQIPFEDLIKISDSATDQEVDAALNATDLNLERAALLFSSAAEKRLEDLASLAQQITRQRFGPVIQLYNPLYLSNECVETCTYCGFSLKNKINRITLTKEQVLAEARFLYHQGFRHLLLVSGEHPRLVSIQYIEEILQACRTLIPSLSLEVAPQEIPIYQKWVQAGADGLILYQETYDRDVYKQVHLAGKKTNFEWRLETLERGGAAGFRRLGLGALFGLADWRKEIFALVAHADYLMRHFWKSMVTISMPRLRPAAGGYTPTHLVTDRTLVHMITALRILLPDVGLVLSTRENPHLRDKLIHLGITQMSAGSKTHPGAYAQEVPVSECQFEIEDKRSHQEISDMLKQNGFDPVWKDWDHAMHEEPR